MNADAGVGDGDVVVVDVAAAAAVGNEESDDSLESRLLKRKRWRKRKLRD